MKKIAVDRMTKAFIEILNTYNNTALLINACHIAKNRYEAITDLNFRLSTTLGIPPEYQLPELEIDFCFKKEELMEQYGRQQIEVLCQNYLVTIVSVFDASLEDIYEMLLQIQDSTLTEKEVTTPFPL